MSDPITKENLLQQHGEFTWYWGKDWFIETPIGNFHWQDPDYGGGNNTITLFEGDIDAFRKMLNMDYGRDKGFHEIERYCGNQFDLIISS